MIETPALDGTGTILRGDIETPFVNNSALLVTEDEHRGITALIRHLKPGVYVKCSECRKLKYGTTFTSHGSDYFCGECS